MNTYKNHFVIQVADKRNERRYTVIDLTMETDDQIALSTNSQARLVRWLNNETKFSKLGDAKIQEKLKNDATKVKGLKVDPFLDEKERVKILEED
jgi:hypothetical protein